MIFETATLIVRPYTLNDAEVFFTINSSEQVMRYIRPVKTREECDAFLKENLLQYQLQPGSGRWAVEEKSTGEVIGTFSLLPLDKDAGKLHMGYALLPPFWGKGYATALLKEGVAYFFKTRPGDKLYAITRIENAVSEKVLLKCGFVLVSGFKTDEHLWTIQSQ